MMPSDSLTDQVIHDLVATTGAQVFAGVNYGSIHYEASKERQEAFNERVSECRNALFLTNPLVDRETLVSTKGKRVAGTCKWIRENDVYKSWLQSDAQLLWICGGPGMGKTMLSIFLAEEFEKLSTERQNAQVMSYFCSYLDEKRNSAVAVLRGLLYQILLKHPDLAKHALPYFDGSQQTQNTIWSLQALWIIFTKLLQDPNLGTTFCVLDGLDECENESVRLLIKNLIGFYTLQDLHPTVARHKLVILSRKIAGLKDCQQIRLDPDNIGMVTSDIEQFIFTRVDDLTRIEGFNETVRIEVQNELLEKSGGTFLWVGFVVDELTKRTTCTEVLDTLRAIPKGLPAMYGRMLLQIESSKRRDTGILILQWVALAIRPLTFQELAAAIDTESSELLAEERVIRDYVALCEPFLRVLDNTVVLVHQSARDYLLREEPDSNPVLEKFRIKAEEAHVSITQVCLDCIEKSALQHQKVNFVERALREEPQSGQTGIICRSNDTMPAQVLENSPLLRYAANYWPVHARCSSTHAKELFDLSRPFFRKRSAIRRNWWTSLQYNRFMLFREFLPTEIPLLHLVAFLGIAPWVEILVDTWRSKIRGFVNAKDKDRRTPLWYEALGGHVATVQLLLRLGADVNARCKLKDTALHRAARKGYISVVDVLLEHRASVNANDESGHTPLHWAARYGRTEVVRMLLTHGADQNAKDKAGHQGTALIRAAHYGHDRVVYLLIQPGTEVNAQDSFGFTALDYASSGENLMMVRQLLEHGAEISKERKDAGERRIMIKAAFQGDEALVRLLLIRGIDVDAKSKDDLTAFAVAASQGHEKIVSLLLEHGAEIDARDSEGRTALGFAVWEGNVAVAGLLLEHGANIHVMHKGEWSLLSLATYQGHEGVARLLLEHGADINAKVDQGVTALARAVGQGHESIVLLLLDYGADINVMHGWTVVHLAASYGHLSVVNRLVELGADLKAELQDGSTPMRLAASSGHLPMVNQLIELGVDPKAESKDGRTPLHSAASGGYLNVVNRLIELGVDPKAESKDGWTPIRSAARNGHLAVVDRLIELGVDPKAESKDGWTPLHSAAHYGHLSVVSRLVDLGSDPNTESKDGWNPLHYAASGGHLDVVNRLIELGVDPNAESKNGSIPIRLAASAGHLSVVNRLVELGADPKAESKDGWTPMRLAASYGHLTVVNRLIELGVDPKAESKDGRTPLYSAASEGHLNVINRLIELGVDLKAESKDGWTPIRSAARNGHLAVVDRLIELGVDPKAESKDGWTLLYSAASGGYLNVVNRLIELGVDPKAESKDGWTPIRSAARNGHLAVVDRLIELGVDPKAESKDGRTPLHSAALGGHLNVVNRLIELGVDLKAESKDGWTPLHSAASGGHLNVVNRLADFEIDIDARAADGQTALHKAAYRGKLNIVEWLTRAGASVDTPDILNRRPLHLALYDLSISVLEHLLLEGADPRLVDGYGRSVFDWMQLYPDLCKRLRTSTTRPIALQPRQKEDHLQLSVWTLTSLLLDRDRPATSPGYHELGHCLLYLQQPADAITAFKQQILPSSVALDVAHNVCCNNCRKNPIPDVRFVCKTCPDVDLCGDCMKEVRVSLVASACGNHDFLPILGPAWHVSASHVNPLGEGRVSWLQREWLQRVQDAFGRATQLQTP